VVCKRVVCECPVNICERVLPINLVVLPMFSYDIILGMDWLMRHSVIIDCVLKYASDAYALERRKSDICWIVSEVFTSNNFGRASKEVYHRRRLGIFGIHCRSNEASKEESERYSCGVRVSRYLFVGLL
jgi:hypothetical protein